MPTIADKRRTFRDLHRAGCFAIPNPFDVGSARFLQHLGFKALATTSAGAAWSLGLPDRAVPRDVMLDHIRDIAAATDLPVNADFGNAFADRPEDVAENVRLCLATGVAGLSVEDQPGDTADALYDVELAVERVAAARAAIDADGSGAVLVARSEAYMVRHPDAVKETLYAPGVRSKEEIADMVKAAGPKAVNILVGGPMGLTVADLAALGVRRISVGGALARAAWGAVIRAAEEIAGKGTFEALGAAANYDALNRFFTGDHGEDEA
jgi:2-methylisocitrate lyase-like PEP mutase family enzyme